VRPDLHGRPTSRECLTACALDGLVCGLTSSVAELTAKLQQAEGAGGRGDNRREVLLVVYEHLQDAFLPQSADSTAQDTFTPPEVRSLSR
jgi:hypothetical protein